MINLFPIYLAVLGDWGLLNEYRNSIDNIIKNYHKNNNFTAIIALGDNFYENGVKSVNDELWNLYYENIYSSINVPWYSVLGNHDYYGDVFSQINYNIYNPSTNWKTKMFFYNLIINNTELFFIDTTQLAPLTSLSLEINSTKLINNNKQFLWLKNKLSKSTAKWKIVIGHYPIYSIGEHGSTEELINNINPLLIKYNVDFYIAGHDHVFTHSKINNINYIVSGCVSKIGSINKINSDYLFTSIKPGFILININVDKISIKYITYNNETIYSYSKFKK